MRSKADDELKGYVSELKESIESRKKEHGGLEGKTLGLVSIAGFIIGSAFILPNITGNAIGSSFSNNYNLFGMGLAVLGLIGFFIFLFRKK